MKALLFFLSIFTFSCSPKAVQNQVVIKETTIKTGAEQTALYLPQLQGKRVALVVNHTTLIGKTHLADSLKNLGVNLKIIFAPEHGFRGTATAGETIKNGKDTRTGLPIISLYGNTKKPTAEHLKDIDIVIFDIQDVGARFYTYISTMLYVMEACAEQNKAFMVLDRPNPNGHYIDGPVLDMKFQSFVGMMPIPIVHGCTVGELAQMINGEKWAKKPCSLTVIPCQNYTHQTAYEPPVAPSPNMPNLQSMLLYPSICLFEPTEISVGRGTDQQFQVIGGPNPAYGSFSFTPVDKPGAMNPVNEGKLCYGADLSKVKARGNGINLSYLLDFHGKAANKEKFFTSPSFFDKLAGTDLLRKQLMEGKTETEIKKSWQTDLDKYKAMRKKYLIYGD